MGRALISYGVDTYRVKKLLKHDPQGLLEDMLEDDAPWFVRCDRLHQDLIAQGAPTAREAMRQVLHGEPLDPQAASIYMDVALLLCEYVGQRLPSSPYKRGVPWDEELVSELDAWLESVSRRPSWFAFSALAARQIGLLESLSTLTQQRAGWLDPEDCEQLDAFFSALHDVHDGDDDDMYDEDIFWDEEDEQPEEDAVLDEELAPILVCLESCLLTCR